MKKLIFTDNIGFDMNDWVNQPIKKVFAGTGCIMAITEDGRTLQKTMDPNCAAAVKYWTRIKDISLSACATGLAIGLVSDGTCLIAKKPARRMLNIREGYEHIPFETVNETIKSWNHIVQVEASDAFFAVTDEGRVCYAPLSRYGIDEYREVLYWENIRRISVGLCDSIIGITNDGHMRCAGANLTHGPHGDLTKRLAAYDDIIDVCMSGSECESIVIAHRNGTVEDMSRSGPSVAVHRDGTVERRNDGRFPISVSDGSEKVLRSHFGYYYYILNSERHLFVSECGIDFDPVFADNPVIDSFAVGANGKPFVIAVTESI
ncbi:MAG: hypothetical protein IKS42_03665 [Oscillospiraceae bacterium]|nr:hypothetical protein [Oscillospiraceae bacterium]